jgi:hypothetical protein
LRIAVDTVLDVDEHILAPERVHDLTARHELTWSIRRSMVLPLVSTTWGYNLLIDVTP